MGMYYYYYYHKFVSFERWVLQDSSLVAKSLGQNATNPQFSRKNVTKSHRSIKVQPLGKRPELFARPRAISFVFEFAILPVPAALLFYVIPQAYAQLSQIFTNQLDYKVSEKEIGASSCGSTRAESLRLSIDSNGTTSKNSDEGFCESDYESMEWGSSKISRNASGEFYGA